MKKLVKSRKNRLVKTMLLSLVVTAALLFSYGASAGIRGDIALTTNNNRPQIRMDDSMISSQSIQMNEPLGDRSEVLLKYHGAFYTGIGYGGAATWEGAIRFTPTELTPYIGWNITEINYYYYDSVSISGSVKIYGAGSPTLPGALLQSTPFTISGSGTHTLALSAPVYINGTDLWVSIEWVQTAAGYPFGADAGPMVVGKGGWLYDGYYGWIEMTYFGLNYNWMLSAKAVGAVFADDVGVTSIISPVSSTVSGAITPKVNVKNFGGVAQTNVPVDLTITRYGTPATYWTDGFETYTPGRYAFPPGWTVTTTNPTGTWFMYNSSLTYSASTYPRVQEALSNGAAQDESITSPTIDCSALTYVHLQMTKYFYVVSPDVSSFTILGSNDNGATFPYTLATYTATSSTAENINISAWAAGQNDVKIKIRYTSDADATLSSYAYFDNFWVGHYLAQPWGPLGDTPPVGWSIQNYTTNPSPWTQNFWHRYTSTYTSYDGILYPARIYYVTPYQTVDCAIITPSIDCSGLSTVKLYANGIFYYSSSYPSRSYIEVSTDGGSTWTDTGAVTAATRYFYEFPGYNDVDLTAWAAHQSNVKIRFRHEHNAVEHGYYWYLSNVRVGSDTNNLIFRDSFNGVQAYSTNFKVWVPDTWSNWAWNRVTGTSAGNQWLNVLTGASPSCSVPQGTRMAEYNSYSATTGDQARIYTDAFNPSAATTLKMSFQMFHDSTTYQTTADQIQVQASTDNGATWTNVGDPFYRSCTLQGLPLTDGWRTWIVDLTDYADATSLRLGFLTTSQYGYNMFIDDIDVFDPGLVTEYTNTVNVNVNAGQTVEAVFPAWTPAAWHVAENTDITYDVAAATDLTGDMDPSNDGASTAVILHYPYLHDIQVVSIDSPITSGPGQTQQVKATVKNIGQYPERNFFVPVQIGGTTYAADFINPEDFESRNGGYAGTGIWQWGIPILSGGPTSGHSGTHVWGTDLDSNYIAGLFTLDTKAFTVPVGGTFTFWHWYDTEASYDGGNVKISVDGGAWTLITPVGGYTGTANSANPLYPEAIWTGHVQKYWEQETFNLAAYAGSSVKIRFCFGADSSVFYPGWYIDDVTPKFVPTITPEYDESAAVASWLQPGQSLQLTYPDWTPANLGIGTSGEIEYAVQATALNSPDGNSANNVGISTLIMSFWHDIGIKKITSPALRGDRDLLFHQRPYLSTESWTFRSSGGTYMCQDNFVDLTAPIGNIEFWGLCLIYSGGWTAGNQNTLPFTVKFYLDNAGAPGAEQASFALAASTPVVFGGAGAYNGYTCYKWTYDLPTAVSLEDGWIGITATGPDNAWILWAGSPEGDLSMYQQGNSVPHIAGDCAFNLSGSSGGTPGVSFYAKPGTQNIANIVTNLGTFVETGLICYAEIWDYSADPNGTLVYTDDATGITLDPLGDEETLAFDSYNFANEGIYALKFNFPLATDDVEANNMKTLGIGIDSTAPVSTATISPATPDGQNGWYKSDVTITLAATDPAGHDVTSGVQKIEYQVDGGSWQTYTAPFKVTTDNAAHVVKYKATDKVGNVEAEKTMPSFKIDKTVPIIAMNYTWEKVGAVYNIIVTATCSDAMSGMAKVEFYFNGALQETVTGAGPDYVWTYQYTPLQNVEIKGIAYDNCGLNVFATLINPTSTVNQQSAQQSHTTVLMK